MNPTRRRTRVDSRSPPRKSCSTRTGPGTSSSPGSSSRDHGRPRRWSHGPSRPRGPTSRWHSRSIGQPGPAPAWTFGCPTVACATRVWVPGELGLRLRRWTVACATQVASDRRVRNASSARGGFVLRRRRPVPATASSGSMLDRLRAWLTQLLNNAIHDRDALPKSRRGLDSEPRVRAPRMRSVATAAWAVPGHGCDTPGSARPTQPARHLTEHRPREAGGPAFDAVGLDEAYADPSARWQAPAPPPRSVRTRPGA